MFSSFFESEINAASNTYDIIASCFGELKRNRSNVDSFFLELCKNQVKDIPGFEHLGSHFDDLHKDISKTARKFLRSGFYKFRDAFLLILKSCINQSKISSLEKVNKKTAVAICMGISIIALDEYEKYNIKTCVHNPQMKTPLNAKHTNCLIYLKKEEKLLMNVAEGRGKNQFRKKIKKDSFNKYLTTVQLAQQTDLPPNLKPYIHKISSPQLSAFKNKKLRIAYIPYIGYETLLFRFQYKGKITTWDQKSDIKGLFHIDYPSKRGDGHIIHMINLLERAINEKANFIIFPELITSPSMFKAIKEHLEKRWDGDDKPEHLFLVFAGTTCIKSGKGKFNNVLRVLKGNGAPILPTYYKYSAFDDGEGSREILSNPGKECAVFDVENIGRVLPSICKDAIDKISTTNLADFFDPNLILIPSWSRSLSTFRTHLKRFAVDNHAISVMCNCCNAVLEKKNKAGKLTQIGLYSFPLKDDNDTMIAESDFFKRGRKCPELNRKCEGCIRFLDIDYSEGVPKIEKTELKMGEKGEFP
jgi:predicted amidohydrolase